ncbi:hypothetical protein Tco_0960879 [Tanacetum coccineum]
MPTCTCSCSTPSFTLQPLNFKGTEGVVGLSQWIEKMESVFHISGCTIDNQVKFATCTLLGAALTWWNGHMRTLGHDAAYAITWGTLKKKLTDKYYPKAYTQRFQELALIPQTLDDAIALAMIDGSENYALYVEWQNKTREQLSSL